MLNVTVMCSKFECQKDIYILRSNIGPVAKNRGTRPSDWKLNPRSLHLLIYRSRYRWFNEALELHFSQLVLVKSPKMYKFLTLEFNTSYFNFQVLYEQEVNGSSYVYYRNKKQDASFPPLF